MLESGLVYVRILQVTPYFAPAWSYGGPPRSVYELSKELVRRGHSVTVLTSDALSPSKRAHPLQENLDGIDVVRQPNLSNLLAWRGQMFIPIGTASFLQGHLADFDIIHLHLFRTLQNAVVHSYATRQGVPYVLSGHGTIPRIVRWQTAKTLFDGAIGARILRDSARLIALSRAEMEQCEAAGVPPAKISIVYHGIDASLYANLPPKGRFVRRHGLEGRQVITYVGRLHQRKGLEHLLQAFRELLVTRPNAALVLVGPDDGQQTTLEQLARRLSMADRVFFAGLIEHPEKLSVFVDSNVVVYPSAHEIFGLVPFEALLCGKPIVVADDSGCGEIVRDTGVGIVVPFGNVPRLREAISLALTNGESIREMTIRGRQFVLDQLNWARIVADVERLYRDAVEH